jgi:hypothetical protein
MSEHLLEQDQLAAAAGSYCRNFSLIRIPKDNSFWADLSTKMIDGSEPPPFEDDEDIEAQRASAVTPEKLATFVHEYLHYLHNFSTLGGLYDLIAQLRMMHVYRAAVGASGHCYGNAELTDEQVKDYQELFRWRSHLRGETRPLDREMPHSRDVNIRICDYSRETKKFQLVAGPMPGESIGITFEMSSKSSEPTNHAMQFGSTCLMEGIAWEIDHAIRGLAPEEPCGRPALAVPYKVARALFEKIVGMAPESTILVKTCLLALQSCDPGSSFCDVAEELAKASRAGKDIAARLDECEEKTKVDMVKNFPGIKAWLDRELDTLLTLAPLVPAVSLMKEQSIAFMELRSRSPYFELEFVGKSFSQDTLMTLLEKYPSCPLVEIGHSADDGRLSIFGKPPPTEEQVQSMGTFQGFMQVGWSHFGQSSIAATEEIGKHQCLMFSACHAPFAKAAETPCKTTPWKTFVNPPPPELCWYAAGVAATRGRRDLK